jgi:DNA-binding LytR/AlgR family response regulator
VNESPLSLALRQLREFAAGRHGQVTVAVVALTATVIGPFGTAERMSFGPRLLYWAAMTVSHALIAVLIIVAVFHMLARWTDQRWPRLAAGGLAASLPLAAIQIMLQRFSAGMPLTLANAVATLMTTVTITLAVTVLVGLVRSQAAPESAAEPVRPAATPPAPRPGSAFLARLSVETGRDLISLTMQDHYIEVRTRTGSTLLLMRLSDAIRELEGVAGMQIHRSHWVARGAVARLIRDDGRMQVELVDGRRLPVSRSFAPDVRATGFPE